MNYPLYNNTLCPAVWDQTGEDYQLKDDVRKALLAIAEDFIEKNVTENDLSLTIKDVILIGSITNFNWTPYSDFDMHIIVDFAELDMSTEDAKVLVDGLKSSWNKEHAITIKGHPVELYIQDITEKAVSMSSYSVKNGEWIKKPTKQKPTFDKEFIKRKHSQIKRKLDDMLKNPSEEKLEEMLERIYDMRQAGLDKKGEFSEENIVFKILRSQGYLDRIRDAVRKVYDAERSLDEVEKIDDAIEFDPRRNDVYFRKDKGGRQDLVPTHDLRDRVHLLRGMLVYGAYQVDDVLYGKEKAAGTVWLPDEVREKDQTVAKYIVKMRKAVKHPKQNNAWRFVERLIDTSIERMIKEPDMDTKNITVLVPLGSTSKLNMIVAEKLKRRLGDHVIILNDFIAKNTWRNVKLSPEYYRVMAGAIAKTGKNKGKLISKLGPMMAKEILDGWQARNPDAEFHVHDLPNTSLRPYFSEFYRAKDGSAVDILPKLKGANVLVIDDTYESGTTLFESVRVLKEFEASSVKGYIFLFGRGT